MKKTQTRRALVTSVLALVLCVALLASSTYAWFTDSATVSVNKIQSGKLKIDLVDADGNTIKGQTIDFIKAGDETEILWEPGCTYKLPAVYVKNIGNLAFKYKVVITGITGDAKLNEAIEWTIDYGFEDGAAEGHMLVTEELSKPITIEGHMKEDAGDEYQDLTIEGISITVIATQDAVEFDSYNNTYDEKADGTPAHPEYVNVNNSTQLKAAMNEAAANEVIVLNSGTYEIDETIKTDGSFMVPENASVTLKLDGNSITTNASSNSDEEKANEPTVLNKGNLTIEGGTISNKNATAGNTNVAAIHNVGGTLTLKDCKIENVSPTSGGAYAVTVEGGKVVLENCNIKGGRGGISVSGDGAIEMKGGSVSAGVYYPLYIGGNGNSTFEGVTFIKQNNSKGKAITYNIFEEGKGTATFKDCVFTTERSAEIAFDIGGKTTGFIFEGENTFTKVKSPNA